MKNKIIVIVLLIVVAVGAFYLGVQNGKGSAAATATAARTAFTRGAGGAGRAGGAGAVMGQIVSVDSANGNLTISLAAGGSQVIFITPTTPVTKTVAGSISDLTSGANILVTGSANSDGSESATSIQIRPAGFATTTRATTGQ